MSYIDKSCSEFAEILAAGTPVPGGGSAAAVKIEPIGFLVVKDDGVRMINVAPPAKNGVDRIIDLVPDVMDKIESIANTNKKTD